MRTSRHGATLLWALLTTWPAAVGPALAGTSTLPAPQVTFSTPGTKTVELTVCNDAGCSTATSQVVVLDPHPQVTAASALPDRLETGYPVQLSGAATGQPTLTFSWRAVPAAGGATVATIAGASAAWDTTGVAPGLYSLTLEVSNASGSATSAPLAVTVTPSTLVFRDSFENGTVPWSEVVQ